MTDDTLHNWLFTTRKIQFCVLQSTDKPARDHTNNVNDVDELVYKFQEHLNDIRSYTYNFNNWSRYMIIGNKKMRNYWKDVEEILKHNYLYNLKLDIKLPKESVQEVQTVYSEQFFVPHRGKKHKGWQSTCIHGIDGGYLENYEW